MWSNFISVPAQQMHTDGKHLLNKENWCESINLRENPELNF